MFARFIAGVAAIVVAAVCEGPTARTADAETRVFTVLVDGKPAGEYRIAIRTADDGTESVSCSAAVQVKQLLGGYRYSYSGTETWKSGRLRQLAASSDDNGKKAEVRATAEGDGLRIVVAGEYQVSRSDCWPTTYWRLPGSLRAKPGASPEAVMILDVDTGQVSSCRLELVGPARLTASGRTVDANHYRVVGQTPADVCYDARGRLVRQETVEDGHKTILELREIQR